MDNHINNINNLIIYCVNYCLTLRLKLLSKEGINVSQGTIVKVSGPLVIAEGMRDANMFDVVRVSEHRLIGEIIECMEIEPPSRYTRKLQAWARRTGGFHRSASKC